MRTSMPPGIPEQPRLLILDDENPTGETLQRMAEHNGFDARHVTRPDAFFSLLASWTPDVVALDLVMPDMDGVDVIRSLAQRGTAARLIIISGVGSRVLDAAERSARAHGLDIVGVLPKPFALTALREMLARAVRHLGHGDHPGPEPGTASPPELTGEDVRQALEARQITLVYQPKISCRTGTLVGFEALARWHHPQRGVIPPDVFIPLAEAGGLIDRLTLDVAEQALSWLSQLPADSSFNGISFQPLLGAFLSLNISAYSLGNRELFARIDQRRQELGVSPERIVLELTESVAMQDVTSALDNLTRLRLQGFQLAIDDFGTGFSSMVQLVKLPFSEIKVDKSFVMTAQQSAESRSIAQSVVSLGQSLDLRTTAEGVEDEATLEQLRGMGCDYAQGFWIARPLAPAAVIPWFRERETARESRRIEALEQLGLLDTPPEARFDRVTRLVQELFSVPTVTISLVARNRVWFKSRQGVDTTQSPRDIAFCDATITGDEIFVIEDARADPHFEHNPQVEGPPFIRFYAGCPLCLPGGETVGTLCVVDTVPRVFSPEEREQLADLAAIVEEELTLAQEDTRDLQTGLLNREAFQAQAGSAVALSRKFGREVRVICVRLLNLAMVNQRLGRPAGDRLIRELADLVVTTLDTEQLMGRRRGTEVAVVMTGPGATDVDTQCQRLAATVRDWNEHQPVAMPRINCEIASACWHPETRASLDQMIRSEWVSHTTIIHD